MVIRVKMAVAARLFEMRSVRGTDDDDSDMLKQSIDGSFSPR